MRNLFYLFCCLILLASCSSTRRAAARSNNNSTVATSNPGSTAPVRSSTSAPRKSSPNVKISPTAETATASSTESAAANTLLLKYAIRLDVPLEEISNLPLLEYIDEWWATPYRYGGMEKTGVDCSGFVQSLMNNQYQLILPRNSGEQYNATKRISKKELMEGDLVFFKTNGRTISHVGVYLRNNKFVHASTSMGVIISDLSEDYYSRRYAGAGRPYRVEN